MKNLRLAIFAAIVVLLVTGGWYGYVKLTDDPYEGMSIIPEQHDDIPLYEGLEPTRTHYVIEGDRWRDVYNYYFEKLPELGWKNEYIYSSLQDDDPENDWGGFNSSWIKKGFDGVLTIDASYNQFDDQTEVMFDQLPILHSSIWIDEVPESICIYKSSTNQDCMVIKDENKILKITEYINNAIDWKEKAFAGEKENLIDFGNINIHVIYEKEKGMYFESEKGLKFMKPEPEFFELIGLGQ